MVIVILGILAAVVVFAVQGVGDKGKASAITIDERTLRTAEEAYCGKNGRYADGSTLIAENLLSDQPKYHQVFAQQSGGTCNGWKYSILRTTQAGAYSPGTWTATSSPPPANLYPVFVQRLADGRVLVGGANITDDSPMTAIWNPVPPTSWTIVDPHPETTRSKISGSTILLTDDPSTPGNECASQTVNNCGKVLLRERYLFDPSKAGAGFGQPQWEILTPPAGCYVCQEGTFSFTPRSMLQIRGTASTCGSLCGKILVHGGNSAGGTPNVLTFDPRDNSYSIISYPVGQESRLSGHTYMSQLPDGRVFLCCRGTGGLGAASDFFDPVAQSFSTGPVPPTRFLRATAVGFSAFSPPENTLVLPNGDLFFGTKQTPTAPRIAASYTPQSGGPGSWGPSIPGCSSASTCRILGLLSDGRVLGRDSSSTATSIYNPVTMVWDSAGSMNASTDPDSFGRAVLLDPSGGGCDSNCGKVFLVGLGIAQLYSPT